MSAQYPSFNDREFDLLKKLVNNSAELADGSGIPLTIAEANLLYFRLDGANSAITNTSSTVLTVRDEFSLTSEGSIALTAGGTNENITLTPSGTGDVTVNETFLATRAGTGNSLSSWRFLSPNLLSGNFVGVTVGQSISGGSGATWGYVHNSTASSRQIFIGFAAIADAITITRGSSNGRVAFSDTTVATSPTVAAVTMTSLGVSGISQFGGAIVAPSTNTSGLQLYNTADQVTNAQRLEVLFGSSVAQIGTRTLGITAATPLHLFTQSTNAGAGYSRIDIQNSSLPLIRQGAFTTVTGTTNSGIGSLTGTFVSFGNWTNQQTSGTNVVFAIAPTYNQASGTAANTDLLINRTQTAVGSGAQLLIQAQVGGVDQFRVFNNGDVNIFGTARYQWASSSRLAAPSNGVITLFNAAEGDFNRLQFGGTTSSFPSIKRNSTNIDFRLADDSAYTTIGAANGVFTGTLALGAATATPVGGSTTVRLVFGTTAGFGIYIGSGAPTVSAAQGSLYLRSDGSGIADRLYVNTNGTTGWTNFVSAT
jgi:hypothetical protein